ncbi:hypothetical protein ACEYW6_20630 [Nostoc sp. UIC 10607]|uniref:hypothetical protein n=1 Tax=Nostoc sp. UIC 10607 TaxID=3045935 RepID=UPI0039A14AB9
MRSLFLTNHRDAEEEESNAFGGLLYETLRERLRLRTVEIFQAIAYYNFTSISINMETKEILQALPNLSISDRLKIAESALQLVLQEKHSLTKDEQKRQLTLAAVTAIADYPPGSELDIFSDLEGEDFYDYPDKDFYNSGN